MNRRDLIRMTADEVRNFIDGRRVLNVATIGPEGRVHLVAMWYGFLPDGHEYEGSIAFWTYAKSQKIKNLERNPRLTGLIETGDRYDQLRGVELVGEGVIMRDRNTVQAVGESVWERYNGEVDEQARAAVAAVGAKRVVVRFDVEDLVSWDHSKLGGGY